MNHAGFSQLLTCAQVLLRVLRVAERQGLRTGTSLRSPAIKTNFLILWHGRVEATLGQTETSRVLILCLDCIIVTASLHEEIVSSNGIQDILLIKLGLRALFPQVLLHCRRWFVARSIGCRDHFAVHGDNICRWALSNHHILKHHDTISVLF